MKKDIWDILFWIAMLILIIYILAKLTGLINTPEWINLLPIITIVFMIGISYQKAISFMGTMQRRTNYLKQHLNNIENKLIVHDERLLLLEKIRKK